MRNQPCRNQLPPLESRIFYTLQSLFLSAFLLGISATAYTQSTSAPEWIWLNDQPKNNQTVYFRKTFSLSGQKPSLKLVGVCDNKFVAYVNGEQVLKNGSWEQPREADVTSSLKPGNNVIAVMAKNQGSVAGLLMKLTGEGNGGTDRNTIVQTDDSWKVTGKISGKSWRQPGFDDSNWGTAYSFGKDGIDPWGPIFHSDPMPAMSSPPGYTIERVYQVPNSQGSWVNMTFDSKGRIITSAQHGPLYRVSPGTDSDQVQVKEIRVRATKPGGSKKSKPLGGAQGLTWAFDSLYVVINKGGHGFGRGLYRVKDQDGDGNLDKAILLKKMDARGEHGLHGIRKGPDGESLYMIAGNHSKLVDLDRSRQPPVWKEDHLLPRIPPPSGHASGIKAPGGAFYKTDPQGQEWELIANGMRNAYDFDFNRHGEPFTFDADMEYDLGLPWYRPTRVTHIPSGAEFGWRNGSGKWPKYYPDSVPPSVEIGQSSPTGVTFGYGTNFPKDDRNALYVGDWSLGRIFAVHLTPDGASYTGTADDFVTGKPLPVSDMDVGPDGALYFITGGRGTDSALYRVTYTGEASESGTTSKQPSKPERQNTRKARRLRHRLERLHAMDGEMSKKQLEFAWSHLSSTDRFIRYAARIAVENASVERWREPAYNETNPQALIMAHLALARHGNKRDRPRMIQQLTRLEWSNLGLQQKRALLRVYALIMSRLGDPSNEGRSAIINQLNPHYPAGNYTLNRELSRVLGHLEAPGVIKKTLHLLKEATAHDQEIHYGYVLRTIENGWSLEQRKTFLQWTNRAMTYGGGRVLSGYVKEIKKRAINTMNGDEKKQLASVIEGNDEGSGPEVRTEIVQNWTMEDLLPAVQQSMNGRNYERGRRMFRVAQCSKCHQMNGAGGITGPNLTTVGQRFSKEYILESIINPSEDISNRYRRSRIKKTDGSTELGRIVNMHGSTLHVMKNPMNPSDLTDIDRSNVESIKPADTSSMPPGLINTLNKQEVLDLMAYLLSGGDPDHEMFQNR